MKIDLKREKPTPRIVERFREIQWKQAPPFLLNPRGILVHRLRSVKCHMDGDKYQHTSVSYLCGGGTSGDGVGEFLHEPPPDRLVCAVCEAVAIAHGLPASSDLVGRHVCIGRVRAERLCCPNEAN